MCKCRFIVFCQNKKGGFAPSISKWIIGLFSSYPCVSKLGKKTRQWICIQFSWNGFRPINLMVWGSMTPRLPLWLRQSVGGSVGKLLLPLFVDAVCRNLVLACLAYLRLKLFPVSLSFNPRNRGSYLQPCRRVVGYHKSSLGREVGVNFKLFICFFFQISAINCNYWPCTSDSDATTCSVFKDNQIHEKFRFIPCTFRDCARSCSLISGTFLMFIRRLIQLYLLLLHLGLSA